MKRSIEEMKILRQQIQEAYDENPNFPMMAKKLGLERKYMGYIANHMGLYSARSSNIIWVDELNVQCSRCERIVPYESLPKIRVGKPNASVTSYCRRCRTNQIIKNNRSSLQVHLGNLATRSRNRIKTGLITPNVDTQYLIDLYEKQEGKCFYTDEVMIFPSPEDTDSVTRLRLSLDKVIPSVGYVRGNVVLCTLRSNVMKSDCTMEEMSLWLPDWYHRLISSEFVDLTLEAQVTAVAHK